MADIDVMIAKLLGLRDFAARVAQEAAPAIEKLAKRSAATGQTPEGEKWVAKKDGSAPLVNAADHVSVKAIGTVVQIVINGPEVYHNKGAGHTLPQRRLLPESADVYAETIKAAATRVFNK